MGPADALNALGIKVPESNGMPGRAIWISLNNTVVGALIIQDALRESARGLGEWLRRLGIRRIQLATGDDEAAEARRVADLAVLSSDIVVLKDDAASLLTVIQEGKLLISVIYENYGWAVGFNLAGISLATLGILNPWLAALFHHVSSVLVVLNSARLVRGT